MHGLANHYKELRFNFWRRKTAEECWETNISVCWGENSGFWVHIRLTGVKDSKNREQN